MESSTREPNILVIIPARGGSKGIPKKNIQPLNGKPLIAYSIEAALRSSRIERVVVSTDSEEIAQISLQFGAEVPFLRPAELSLDETPTLPVLQHLISQLKALENYEPDLIVLLQPTSPLRQTQDIENGIDLLIQSGADSVVGLCLAEHSPYWMQQLEGDRVVPFCKNSPEYSRRQDAPPVYRINGALYVTSPRVLQEENEILGKDTRGLIMDAESSIDIDTALDFKIASLILKERNQT